jgi:hypothetical protein
LLCLFFWASRETCGSFSLHVRALRRNGVWMDRTLRLWSLFFNSLLGSYVMAVLNFQCRFLCFWARKIYLRV